MVVDAGEPVAYAGGDDDYVAGFELVGGGVADVFAVAAGAGLPDFYFGAGD